MSEVAQLARQWIKAKEAEGAAKAARQALEDKIAALVSVSAEGVATTKEDGYEIKVTGRINRRVDSDRLQELAAEAGLTDHLSSLFRWKPEVNLSVWKATDKAITTPLAAAITSEPGRPSFSITKKDV